jgi:hypothetical protein
MEENEKYIQEVRWKNKQFSTQLWFSNLETISVGTKFTQIDILRETWRFVGFSHLSVEAIQIVQLYLPIGHEIFEQATAD